MEAPKGIVMRAITYAVSSLCDNIHYAAMFFLRFVREESSCGQGKLTTTEEEDAKVEDDFIKAVRKTRMKVS